MMVPGYFCGAIVLRPTFVTGGLHPIIVERRKNTHE